MLQLPLFSLIFSGIIERMFGLMDEIEAGFREHEAAMTAACDREISPSENASATIGSCSSLRANCT